MKEGGKALVVDEDACRHRLVDLYAKNAVLETTEGKLQVWAKSITYVANFKYWSSLELNVRPV